MRDVALLSLVTAWLAFTVSETKLFAPVRTWVADRSRWLGELVACGYCSGFWVALALTVVYRPRLFAVTAPLDYLLTALAIAWLAAFQWAILCVLLEKAGK